MTKEPKEEKAEDEQGGDDEVPCTVMIHVSTETFWYWSSYMHTVQLVLQGWFSIASLNFHSSKFSRHFFFFRDTLICEFFEI